MTKPKYDNSLFIHIKSTINSALQLEYAIRYLRAHDPEIQKKWRALDLEIRAYWRHRGATEAEIDAEDLMDFAWDAIQFNYPLSRTHNRVYQDKEFLNMFHTGLLEIRSAFASRFEPLQLPITRYFRVCDLLNGNDIHSLMIKTAKCLEMVEKYSKKSEIEIEHFLQKIREPIMRHPGVIFTNYSERDIRYFGFSVDLNADISAQELKQQIQEFIYRYADLRLRLHPSSKKNGLSRELIQDFLEKDLQREDKENVVNRIDSFLGALAGIYCWDIYCDKKSGKIKDPLAEAINDTAEIYSAEVTPITEEAIKAHYNSARKRIECLRFP